MRLRGRRRPAAALAACAGAAASLVAACSPALPEPDSPGARILDVRCAGCHRTYAPGTMTFPMWEYQLERMRALYAQQGLPWLTPAEERTLREYLARHAGGR